MPSRHALLVLFGLIVITGCGGSTASEVATDVISRQVIEGAFSSVTVGQAYSATGRFASGQGDARQTIEIDAAIDANSASAEFREKEPGQTAVQKRSVIVTKDRQYLVGADGRWVLDDGLPFADTKSGWQELISDKELIGAAIDFVAMSTPSEVTREDERYCTGGPVNWEKARSEVPDLFGPNGSFAALTGGSVSICVERDGSGTFHSPTVEITMSGPGDYAGTVSVRTGGPSPVPAPAGTASGDGEEGYNELAGYFFRSLTHAFTGMQGTTSTVSG